MKAVAQNIKWVFLFISIMFLVWGLKYARTSNPGNNSETTFASAH